MASYFRTRSRAVSFTFFFFPDSAPTGIYTLSLHDALPIYRRTGRGRVRRRQVTGRHPVGDLAAADARSEEHTSELQSRRDLVCRLLLEKKKRIRRPEILRPPDTYIPTCEVVHYQHIMPHVR